jgi:hypothetical protein
VLASATAELALAPTTTTAATNAVTAFLVNLMTPPKSLNSQTSGSTIARFV